MERIQDTNSTEILRHWIYNCKRRAVIKTYKDFNPLPLVSEILAFAKTKTSDIIILTDNEFYKQLYLQLFKESPYLSCKVWLPTDTIDKGRLNTALIIIDEGANMEGQGYKYINVLEPQRYVLLSPYVQEADIKLEYEKRLPQTLFTYKLDIESSLRYIKYHNYVVDKYRLFKSLARHFEDTGKQIPNTPYDIMRYCMHGIYINDVKLSYNQVCAAIAKEEGWTKELQPDSNSNKAIIETFAPDNLHEIAKRFNQYSNAKNDMLAINKQLMCILNDTFRMDDVSKLLVIHDTTKTAEFITRHINIELSNGYQSVLAVGNTLESHTVYDYNTKNLITDKRGKPKVLGTTLQNRFANQACNEGHVNLFNAGKTVKPVNVPECIDTLLMCTVDETLLTRFLPSTDVDDLISGEQTKGGLTHLRAFSWFLTDFLYDADGTVIIPKPLADLIKMVFLVNDKRPFYVTVA